MQLAWIHSSYNRLHLQTSYSKKEGQNSQQLHCVSSRTIDNGTQQQPYIGGRTVSAAHTHPRPAHTHTSSILPSLNETPRRADHGG